MSGVPPRRFLASPRRRRRLLILMAAAALVLLVAVVVWLAPSKDGSPSTRAPHAPVFGGATTTAPAPPFATTVSAAEERARERAEAETRPLAAAFITAMATRTGYEKAHALLAYDYSTGSVLDWERGRSLPLSLPKGSTYGGETVAYSDARTVGAVSAVNEPGDSAGGLVALVFKKTNGSWAITYIHAGHASAYVDASNYSPAGFLPGGRHETRSTWLILVLGLIGIVALVGVVDWGMSRARPRLG